MNEPEDRRSAPQLRCPRCAEPTTRASSTVCQTCGLCKACASCGERFEDPLHQRFCASCATPVEQPAWSPAEPSSTPPVQGPAPSSKRPHMRPSVPAPVANLFTMAEPPAAISSLGERARRRGGRIAVRTARKVFLRNLGGLYNQLGEALMERERFRDATDAYRSALNEAGEDQVWRSQIYASLAESTAAAAEQAPAMRADAVRTALEAALHAPDVLADTVERVRTVIDAETLSAHGAWIADEWWPRAERVAGGNSRVDCAVLAGRAALFIGDHATALSRFREARSMNAAVALTSSRSTLTSPLVPDALLEVAPAEAHWVQAQAREAVGDDDGALKEIELALAHGFPAGDPADIGARELLAGLLERQGQSERAALAIVGLSRALTELARYEEATERLEHATALAPDAPEPWWQLADTRRFVAQLEDGPFVDGVGLLSARDAALEGFARRPPEAQDAWAYCMFALIDDQLADLEDQPDGFLADGLLAAEQALAVDGDKADAWALTSRFCRKLGFLESALRAANRAVATDDESVLAAQEQVIMHADLGSAEARSLLSRHKATLSGFEAERQAVAGYLHLLDGNWHDALRKLGRAVRSGADDPFVRLHRGLACELISGPDAAAADYEWIRRKLSESPTPYRWEQAWATLLTGQPQEAARLFDRLPDQLAGARSDRPAGQAACAALQGDRAMAQRWLEEALRVVRVRSDAATIALFASVLGRRSEDPATRVLFEAAREQAATAAKTVAPIRGELKGAVDEVDRLLGSVEPGSPIWRATGVLRARLAGESDDWMRAAELYDELADAGEPERPFPELVELRAGALRQCSDKAQRRGDVAATQRAQGRLQALGLLLPGEREVAEARAYRANEQPERAVELLASLVDLPQAPSPESTAVLLEAGDLLLVLSAVDLAERAFLRALAAAETGTIALGQLQLRLGLLAALRDEIGEARQWLVLAIDSTAATAGELAVGRVVDELDDLIPEDGRRRLDSALRALQEDPLLLAGRRRKLAAARFHSVRRRRPEPRIEPLAAVAISVDARLFPQGARSGLAVRLVEDECPALRQRVVERTGVRLPGVTVRSHAEPLEDGMDYTILVREIRLASGMLPEGARLCRQGEACRKLGLQGQALVIGQGIEDAMWLREDEAEVAYEAGLPLLDHAAAAAWHVELTVRPHLSQFVGVSEVDYEVDKWAAQEDGARRELIERALPSHQARLDFARLVHRLVEQQVPVDRIDRLLASFEEARKDELDLSEMVAKVRRDLAVALPASRFDRSAIELDGDLERQIESSVVHLGHTRLLAIPERDLTPLLTRLDTALGSVAPSAVALVVSNDGVRPFVQRLVDSSWPGVPVISQAELAALTETVAQPEPMVVL